jgi:hypothetical protein
MIKHLSGKTRGVLAAAVVLGSTALAAPLSLAAAEFSGLVAQADQAATGQTAKAQDIEKHVEAEVTRLHQQLHITQAQEQQWQAVATVMRSNAAEMGGLVQQRSQNASAMSAVDDLRSYQQIAEAHAQELSKLVPPFEALYSAMSDEQKQNADVVFGHMHGHAQASKGRS